MTNGSNNSMSAKNSSDPDSMSFSFEDNNVTISQNDNKNFSVVNARGSGDKWNASMNYQKNKTDQAEHLTHRIKFDKYFMFAMDTTGMKIGSKTKQCKHSKDCGSGYQKMCCVNAVMTDQKNGLQDTMFRCMNYKIASANFEFSMNGMSVAMKCIGDDKKSRSGAGYFSLSVLVSLMSLIAIAFN